MKVYLGSSEKLKITSGTTTCALKIPSMQSPISNQVLMSSDGIILCDCNGLYLLAKEAN